METSMIKELVQRFDLYRDDLRMVFTANEPNGYDGIVKAVVGILGIPDDIDYPFPSASHITVIDHGDYQGTRMFVFGEAGYQPSNYWYVRVLYGSCSSCDTFQRIVDTRWIDDDNGAAKAKRVDDYMTLALHIVQNIKEMP